MIHTIDGSDRTRPIGHFRACRYVMQLMSILATFFVAPAWPSTWPAWEQFSAAYIREDGRVVDWTADARTVSEGQAYALFFALVAKDPGRFDLVLQWTQNNLAQGDLNKHLPAWLWGKDANERWGVLDPNSATDANLWLAYTLLQAARLWNRPALADTAQRLLAQIAASGIRRVGTLTVLLPGEEGFEGPSGIRLNPSYLPPFQLKYLASIDASGPWQSVLATYVGLLPDLSPGGRMPDWFLLSPEGPRLDIQTDGQGSYDAIRVFLWAGFGPDGMVEAQALRKAVRPFINSIRIVGRMPERWYPDGRAPIGVAPPGFDAAMLPLLAGMAAFDLENSAHERLNRARVGNLIGTPARYYDQVLALFGEGFVQRRFRFGPDGRLELP